MYFCFITYHIVLVNKDYQMCQQTIRRSSS